MVRAILLPLALLLACGAAGAEPYKGFARGDALVAPAELKALLDGNGSGPKPVVLAAVGRLPWLLGRVPGAQRVLRRGYTGRNGMAAGRARFQAFARGLGINGDTPVVIYDNAYRAARLWWLFRLYGKADVRVLDGGWRAWDEAGYPVERGPGRGAPPDAGNFTARARARRLGGRVGRGCRSPAGSGDAAVGRARHTGMEGDRPHRPGALHRLAGVSQGG